MLGCSGLDVVASQDGRCLDKPAADPRALGRDLAPDLGKPLVVHPPHRPNRVVALPTVRSLLPPAHNREAAVDPSHLLRNTAMRQARLGLGLGLGLGAFRWPRHPGSAL